jgi:hypothetical protein
LASSSGSGSDGRCVNDFVGTKLLAVDLASLVEVKIVLRVAVDPASIVGEKLALLEASC